MLLGSSTNSQETNALICHCSETCKSCSVEGRCIPLSFLYCIDKQWLTNLGLEAFGGRLIIWRKITNIKSMAPIFVFCWPHTWWLWLCWSTQANIPLHCIGSLISSSYQNTPSVIIAILADMAQILEFIIRSKVWWNSWKCIIFRGYNSTYIRKKYMPNRYFEWFGTLIEHDILHDLI